MTPIGSRRMTLVAPYAYSIDAWPVSVRAAPAMNRRLSTENGMSPSRACLIVFPWFWTSIGARWSMSASIRFASLNNAAARSPGVMRGHFPLSNAARAASIAARVSCTSACGTAAIFPPVAGLITVYVASVWDGTHSPFT